MKLPNLIKKVYVLCAAETGDDCRECPLYKNFQDDIDSLRLVCFKSIDDLIADAMDDAGYVEVRRSAH